MNEEEVRSAIEDRLKETGGRVLNRNAFRALFAAFGGPVDALGQLFMGRADATDAERQRLGQEAVLELVCRIDAVLKDTISKLESRGGDPVIVAGFIETDGRSADDVTGVEISSGAGPVEFTPGTRIRTTGTDSRNVTGLRIGAKETPS